MFSENRKKSKGWIILIPFLIIFIAGLWMNAFMGDDETGMTDKDDTAVYSQQEVGQSENDSNEIPIYEYDDNSGDDEEQDVNDNSDEDLERTDDMEGSDEPKVVGLADYFMIIYEDEKVKVQQFKDGILIEETLTDVEINALPQYDRDSLERGIVLLTQEEVDMLMENYAG